MTGSTWAKLAALAVAGWWLGRTVRARLNRPDPFAPDNRQRFVYTTERHYDQDKASAAVERAKRHTPSGRRFKKPKTPRAAALPADNVAPFQRRADR